MIFNLIYETILIISDLNSKWYIPKFYIKYQKRKLIKKLYMIKMIELDRNFFIELFQFNSITEIFKSYEGNIVSVINLLDNLEVRLYSDHTQRRDIINVKYVDRTTNTRINKDFTLSINKDRTTFNDKYINIIINFIYDSLYENISDYIRRS